MKPLSFMRYAHSPSGIPSSRDMIRRGLQLGVLPGSASASMMESVSHHSYSYYGCRAPQCSRRRPEGGITGQGGMIFWGEKTQTRANLMSASASSRSMTTITRLFSSTTGSTTRNFNAGREEVGTNNNKVDNRNHNHLAKANTNNMTDYERLVRRLYQINLFHPVKMGLSHMEQLHELMGNPMDDTSRRFVVHVAGTNGKGSVAMKVAKTLEAAGYTTGLFVSPHISSFRERMQVNSTPISEEEVCHLLPYIFQLCQTHDISATFFEVTTALAFAFFQHRNVDVVVLEVGLGGRLDATNVIQKPALSMITSIGLEHTRILGDTVDLICFEKAGIVKPHHPTLIGPGVQPIQVVQDICQERHSDLYLADELVAPPHESESTSNNNHSATTTTTLVDYDIENSRIAQAAIQILRQQGHFSGNNNKHDVTEKHIQQGTSQRPPCRFETMEWTPSSSSTKSNGNGNGNDNDNDGGPVSVVLDVAHNPDALEFLLAKLEATFGSENEHSHSQSYSVRFVVGFSSDKDLLKCGNLLLSYLGAHGNGNADADSNHNKRIHVVQAAHPRAATVEQLLEACPALADHAYLQAPPEAVGEEEENSDESASSIAAQVKAALRLASSSSSNSNRREIVVICGSVFIMSEARETLGVDEPRDSNVISEVAGINLRHGQENFANSTSSDDETTFWTDHDDGDGTERTK
jgi:dihydrofolate synthase/folylpolyglutamate synthase